MFIDIVEKSPILSKKNCSVHFLASFTLTEVLVGAVILVASYGVLLLSFTSARSYVFRANKRIIAANLARNELNNLYAQVGQDNWDTSSGPFYFGVHNLNAVSIDGITYPRSYNVTPVAGRDYRQITVTIQYPVD